MCRLRPGTHTRKAASCEVFVPAETFSGPGCLLHRSSWPTVAFDTSRRRRLRPALRWTSRRATCGRRARSCSARCCGSRWPAGSRGCSRWPRWTSAGLLLGIWTALEFKQAVRGGPGFGFYFDQALDVAPLAGAGDAAALRALPPVRRPHPAPRLLGRGGLPVPDDGGDLPLRRGRGLRVPVVLHLLRRPVLRAVLRGRACASSSSASASGCSRRPATAAGRCWWAPAPTSTAWPTRCAARRSSRWASCRSPRGRATA